MPCAKQQRRTRESTESLLDGTCIQHSPRVRLFAHYLLSKCVRLRVREGEGKELLGRGEGRGGAEKGGVEGFAVAV